MIITLNYTDQLTFDIIKINGTLLNLWLKVTESGNAFIKRYHLSFQFKRREVKECIACVVYFVVFCLLNFLTEEINIEFKL